MAVLIGTLSVQVQDADGEITSIDFPFSNSTNSLTDILTWVAGLLQALDVVIDPIMKKAKICLNIALPGGARTVPTAGAEIERTGLLSFTTPAVLSNYSEDIAGFAYSKFINNAINTADPQVAAFITYLTTVTAGTESSDRDGNALGSLARARKTFRKHRKSTNRA